MTYIGRAEIDKFYQDTASAPLEELSGSPKDIGDWRYATRVLRKNPEQEVAGGGSTAVTTSGDLADILERKALRRELNDD